MNAEIIVKLLDAGFTKEDIIALAGNTQPSTSSSIAEKEPEQVQPSAPEAAPQEEKEPDISEIIGDKITEAFKPFKNLYDNMAKMAGMPSIQDVQPKGIEDIITEFFKGE